MKPITGDLAGVRPRLRLLAVSLAGLMVVLGCGSPTVASNKKLPPVHVVPYVVQHTTQLVLPNDQTVTGTASCGPGEVLLSGGFDTTALNFSPGGGSSVVYDSYPSDASGNPPTGQGQIETSWSVRADAYFGSPSQPPQSIPITANCLAGSDALSGVWFHTFALQYPGGPYTASVGCTDLIFATLTGGGYHYLTPGSLSLMGTYPTAPNGLRHKAWTVELYHNDNISDTPHDAHGTEYAVCLSQLYDAPLAEQQILAPANFSAATVAQVSVGCPVPGELLVGGGYRFGLFASDAYADALVAPQLTTWRAATWVESPTPQPITVPTVAWGICVATVAGVVPTPIPGAIVTVPPVLAPTPVGTHFVPVVGWQVTPTAFQQSCTGAGTADALPALTLTLNNGGSNVAVGYQVTINNKSPNGREPWATASPASGTVAAGQRGQLTLIPASDLCYQWFTAGTQQTVTYTVSVQLTSGGSGTTTVTDSIAPFFAK